MKQLAISLLILLAALPDAAYGQAEILAPGRLFANFTYVRSDTGARFDFLGDRVRIIPPAGKEFRGQSVTNVLALDVSYGLRRNWEVHVTIPYAISQQRSILPDGSTIQSKEQSPSSTGFSNVKAGFRYNVWQSPWVITAKCDVKFAQTTPDLEQQFNGTTLPISEGQIDLDMAGQISRTIRIREHPISFGGEGGYRVRFTQGEGALDTFTRTPRPVKPPNEFFYSYRVAYPVWRRFTLLATGSGIEAHDYDVPFRLAALGNDGRVVTVGTQGAPDGFVPDYRKQTGRRISALGPLAAISLGHGTSVAGGVLFTLSGQNYPAGKFWVISLSKVLR